MSEFAMVLPPYDQWKTVVPGLRQAARLLGALQRLTQPPQPAYLELALQVQPRRFAAGRLPRGGQAWLDLAGGALVYAPAEGGETAFPLEGRTQAQLFAAFFGLLAETELSALLPPGEDLFDRVSRGIAAQGRYRQPHPDLLLDRSALRVDPQASKRLLIATREIYAGIASFLAHLSGLRTPLVVWPEGFDLSTLLFSGTEIDEEQPHLNFGFAPLAEEGGPAYLYAYAYPYPVAYDPPRLPEHVTWHTKGWTGALLPYDTVAAQADPRAYVEEVYLAIHASLSKFLAG